MEIIATKKSIKDLNVCRRNNDSNGGCGNNCDC